MKTRRQFRDDFRTDLGLPIALDKGGASGDPAATHPRPSNRVIDKMLDEALSEFCVECGFQVATTVTESVDAQTADGPYAVSLSEIGTTSDTGGLRAGDINEVRRVLWDDGSTQTVLTPKRREELERDGRNLSDEPAGVPRHWWIEGYTLNIWPSPEEAGTLRLIVGSGVVGFLSDGDVIESLPRDHQVGVRYLAVALYAESKPNDPEMLALASVFRPKAQLWMQRTLELPARIMPEHQAVLEPFVYRQRR